MVKAILNVARADNEVAAYLNGIQVYDKKTEGNPALNDAVEVTDYLVDGLNALVVIGVNWGGPCAFVGSVAIGKVTIPFRFEAANTPNGIAWTQTFVLTR